MSAGVPAACLRALDGGTLAGGERVRFVFMDESGITTRDRVTVVAAVIVHADTQWMKLADHLSSLFDEHVPAHLRRGFICHAIDLFSGKSFGEPWPPLKSWALLDGVLETAHVHGTPLAIGIQHHVEDARLPGLTRKQLADFSHLCAFGFSIEEANRLVRDACPGEVGTIITEKNKEMQKTLSGLPEYLRRRSQQDGEPCRLDRIVGSVLHAEKGAEPLLQLADAYAFAVRRHLAGLSEGKRLVEIFAPGEDFDIPGDTGGSVGVVPFHPDGPVLRRHDRPVAYKFRVEWQQ